jgi:hypothetical protein
VRWWKVKCTNFFTAHSSGGDGGLHMSTILQCFFYQEDKEQMGQSSNGSGLVSTKSSPATFVMVKGADRKSYDVHAL